MKAASEVQHLLVNEAKASYEYDPARALGLWHLLAEHIPANSGYGEGDWLNDEGRIIYLFELLNGSQFGDMIFGSVGDDDQGSTLATRTWDE